MANYYHTKLTAQVATIVEREWMLRLMIPTIANQVDVVNVMLNLYTEVPEWIKRYGNVKCRLMDNSTGDAAKFYGIENLKGYIFLCDDDILYPDDYIETLIKYIEKYERYAIISFHGRILRDKPVKSYYKDRKEAFRYQFAVSNDTRVDSAGTGVMGFHSSTINLRYSDFRSPNMADVWVAKFAHEQGVPLIVAKHGDMWLRTIDVEMKMLSIWEKHYNDDREMTDLYNSF